MISREQVAELVALYSSFHGAIDPFDPAVVEAEQEFYAKLKSLHQAHAADVSFAEFRATLFVSANNTCSNRTGPAPFEHAPIIEPSLRKAFS